MARKTLITEAKVLAAWQAGQSTLTIPVQSLVTPLAHDTAREKGIALVPQPTQPVSAEPACGCQTETPAETGCACTPPVASPQTVVLGSDHGGFAYKDQLKTWLQAQGWTVWDVGTHSEASCDYPDFAYTVARIVAQGEAPLGIMLDGAGIGSAMVCNKVPGIRAACAYNEFTAWNARAHNNANVLTLGSRTLGIEVCKAIVEKFLNTPFEGGRHANRVQKIGQVEARFSAL